MKRKVLLVIAVASIAAMSFKMAIEKTGAIASEQNGIVVFAFSKPTAKYDILGQSKVKGLVKNTTGPHMVEVLVQQAKDEYPSAEAIILNTKDFFSCEVVRFRD